MDVAVAVARTVSGLTDRRWRGAEDVVTRLLLWYSAVRAPPVRGEGEAHLFSDESRPSTSFWPEDADIRASSERRALCRLVTFLTIPASSTSETRRRTLQRQVRAGRRSASTIPVPASGQRFRLAHAQLVVARSYGFPSWARLRRHLETVARYSRSPHKQPVGGSSDSPTALADDFLRLACLTYGRDVSR